MSRVVSWYSCGAASAIATKLTLKDAPAAEVVYCETGGEHSDNERFLIDCEIWFLGRSLFESSPLIALPPLQSRWLRPSAL